MSEWWLVKYRCNTGGDSIVMRVQDKEACMRYAAQKNSEYQSDNYYVEQWRDDR